MSDPRRKIGDCHTCRKDGVNVTYNPRQNTWFCDECWPDRPIRNTASTKQQRERDEAEEYNRRWDALVERHYGKGQPKALDLYGISVQDSRHYECDFMVSCPEHGVVEDGLTMAQARVGCEAHTAFHRVHVATPVPLGPEVLDDERLAVPGVADRPPPHNPEVSAVDYPE